MCRERQSTPALAEGVASFCWEADGTTAEGELAHGSLAVWVTPASPIPVARHSHTDTHHPHTTLLPLLLSRPNLILACMLWRHRCQHTLPHYHQPLHNQLVGLQPPSTPPALPPSCLQVWSCSVPPWWPSQQPAQGTAPRSHMLHGWGGEGEGGRGGTAAGGEQHTAAVDAATRGVIRQRMMRACDVLDPSLLQKIPSLH